jgi:hypothetical protein
MDCFNNDGAWGPPGSSRFVRIPGTYLQSDSYKPPDRHRINDMFAVGERFQGLEFFVRKPDRNLGEGDPEQKTTGPI